jgi:NADH:ubiquinone oxidoreductase subunit 6 (subunit J)
MWITFGALAALILFSAVAAVTLRNLVHCALALTVSFAGLAGMYLQLNAQFIGFSQLLVYIGAVAILVVFAIMLTRGSEPPPDSILSPGWALGATVATGVLAVLTGFIISSRRGVGPVPTASEATVRGIGDELMTKYILPLEVLGLLLTAALIGAVIIAMSERNGSGGTATSVPSASQTAGLKDS